MSYKNKIEKKNTNLLPTIGMLLMSLASIAGFFEFTDANSSTKSLSLAKSAVLPSQTVFNPQPAFNSETNQIYREKEEQAPEYISYNEMRSTAPRSSRY